MGDAPSDLKTQNQMVNRFLTANEVTGMLQISIVTLRAWTSQKKIPYYKVGRSVRFNLLKLQEWLNQREIKSRR
ncbi:MAG: DNA-binding protein [Candidatus Omnitrophica bacterium]|nr:DNA-binding protein [Candidatus Omnitrophota bacterium]